MRAAVRRAALLPSAARAASSVRHAPSPGGVATAVAERHRLAHAATTKRRHGPPPCTGPSGRRRLRLRGGRRWRECAVPARPSRGPPAGTPPPLLCAGAPPAGCAAERSAIWVKQWHPFLWKWRRRRPVQRREGERGIHSPVQRIEGSCDPSYSFPCSDSDEISDSPARNSVQWCRSAPVSTKVLVSASLVAQGA